MKRSRILRIRPLVKPAIFLRFFHQLQRKILLLKFMKIAVDTDFGCFQTLFDQAQDYEGVISRPKQLTQPAKLSAQRSSMNIAKHPMQYPASARALFTRKM
ncbi:hypothetical protein [Stutzerimonas azotifigens]|uniref:Uncharacterized protein n=1 Tax=Stutzerimonas azotifigens TaxID=291995 RepID=A0ABR5Z1K5_9GAMM|nr:hypothetical protein [Stutzerimonas azotifigens]MBA1274093.1 hypothetical protein [Stutzerimonas azotifigens]